MRITCVASLRQGRSELVVLEVLQTHNVSLDTKSIPTTLGRKWFLARLTDGVRGDFVDVILLVWFDGKIHVVVCLGSSYATRFAVALIFDEAAVRAVSIAVCLHLVGCIRGAKVPVLEAPVGDLHHILS